MLALPEGFLCNGRAVSSSSHCAVGASEFLFDTIFSRPPMSVIREALQLLSEKASASVIIRSSEELGNEPAPQAETALNLDQIHIAIKQLKLDLLSLNNSEPSASDEEKGESTEESRVSPPKEVLQLKLQITIELIRIHLLSRDKDFKSRDKIDMEGVFLSHMFLIEEKNEFS